MKVHIATSRPLEIGNRCTNWASKNLPKGAQLTKSKKECDVLISVLYDTLITEQFIREHRCYNFHPGLLPDYRGSGAYSWAIINKEKKTGVTLHEIDKDIDHGAIIDVRRITIFSKDTAETLFVRSMNLLYDLFIINFHRILSGNYETWENTGGHLYLRKDLEKAKDITYIVRAFTFAGKESAYWYDNSGTKRYIEWE